eukprot:1158781-Pelagomonas_calceolata.AAC.5
MSYINRLKVTTPQSQASDRHMTGLRNIVWIYKEGANMQRGGPPGGCKKQSLEQESGGPGGGGRE